MTHRLVLLVLAAIVMAFAYWQFEQRQQSERAAVPPQAAETAPAGATPLPAAPGPGAGTQ